MERYLLIGLLSIALAAPARSQDHHDHHDHQPAEAGHVAAEAGAGPHEGPSGTVTVKGEVLDLVCYIDHEARGAKHAECARTCIESGLPVGLKAEDGTLYILVGEHKPMNEVLAAHAARTITVRGKAATRDGVHLLENAEILAP